MIITVSSGIVRYCQALIPCLACFTDSKFLWKFLPLAQKKVAPQWKWYQTDMSSEVLCLLAEKHVTGKVFDRHNNDPGQLIYKSLSLCVDQMSVGKMLLGQKTGNWLNGSSCPESWGRTCFQTFSFFCFQFYKNLFLFVTDEEAKSARVFVPGKPF